MKINLNYSIRRPFELNSALSSSVTFAFSSSILIFSFERSSMLSLIVVASWCFCAKNFPPWISRQPLDYQKSQKPTCNLLLSKPRELSISAFFRSQTVAKVFLVGTSGPKGQVEFLAEYNLRTQCIRPLGSGTTPGLHLSTSLDLHFHLFLHPMYRQQSQRSSGHLI